jgi:hypothetical protein
MNMPKRHKLNIVSLSDLLEEYKAVRQGLISVYSVHSTQKCYYITGKMTSGDISVLAFPFILAGHQRWHFEIIKEKYTQL